MSYCPAFDWPSWNALAKNESYGSVRNWTLVPVAFSNIGRIVSLHRVSAAASHAPMTRWPPPPAAALGAAAAGAGPLDPLPHAPSNGIAAAAVRPHRRTS